jgi:hypothetical protein
MLKLGPKIKLASGVLVLLAALGLASFVVRGRQYAPSIAPPPTMEKLRLTEQVRDPNRLFGYIKSIQHKDGKVFVEFDLAEFFGRSATDANQISEADIELFEDGRCPGHAFPSSDCDAGDFYIRNNDPSTRPLELTDRVKITSLHYLPSGDYTHTALQDLIGFREPKVISLKEFETIFKLLDVPGTGIGASDTANSVIPYTFTLKNSKIVEIEENMTP